MHRQNSALNSYLHNAPPSRSGLRRFHVRDAVSCFLKQYRQAQKCSKVQSNRPDVRQKCTFQEALVWRWDWSVGGGESCDLCEAGSHVSTRAEQQADEREKKKAEN